jgi:hypothetical protein
LAVERGYDPRRPDKYPTPFEPTELIPFGNERLYLYGREMADAEQTISRKSGVLPRISQVNENADHKPRQ